eukprot:m.114490 g.114490  ORF g.114490 m.114490 type:complete len:477 (-) comp16025_c0_seq11:1515-2945(-)
MAFRFASWTASTLLSRSLIPAAATTAASRAVLRSTPARLFSIASSRLDAASAASAPSNPASTSSPSPSTPATAVDDGFGVYVTFPDGTSHRFHKAWLRHNCTDKHCVEQSSGQVILPSNMLEYKNDIASINFTADNTCMEIVWAKDNHVSVFDLSTLRSFARTTNSASLRVKQREKPTMPAINFDMLMAEEDALFEWLRSLSETGYCMIKRAPMVKDVVQLLAYRISHPMPTIYGEVFDVVSQPNPINVAYTSLGLELHQDLIYYESAPGLQLLHCLRFDDEVTGGETTLLDGLAAAERFREVDPKNFDALVRIPAYFKKVHYDRELPVHMVTRRPHIMLNDEKEIISLSWAPPFHAPQRGISFEKMDQYYQAIIAFSQFLSAEHKRVGLEFRMKPGEILCFNNRRILHGRNAFESKAEGDRHLQGVYINIDEFKSMYHYLSRSRPHAPLHRVGNNDYFVSFGGNAGRVRKCSAVG